MALNPQEAEEEARKAALANQGTRTYPAGEERGPGLTQGPVQTPGPASAPPSPTQPNSQGATPAPTGNGQAGGGVDLSQDQGTPQQKIDNMPAGEMEQRLASSAAHVAGMETPAAAEGQDEQLHAIAATAKRRQVGEAMAGQGANPRTALERERDKRLKQYKAMYKAGEIDHSQHEHLKWSWKNIFEVIPEEDFGLVMMDFGMRAMMAGETMGDVGAIGAAGAGALQGIQDRKQQGYERRAGQFEAAEAGAVGALQEGRTPTETLSTEGGVMEWKDGKWQYVQDEEGNRVMPSTLATRPPVDKWKIDWMVNNLGIPESEAGRRVLGGVSPEQIRQDALAAWNRFEQGGIDAQITIGDKTYTKSQIRRGQEAGLREQYIGEALSVFGYGPTAGGALQANPGGPPSSDATPPRIRTEKPDNWTDDQWETYKQATKQ